MSDINPETPSQETTRAFGHSDIPVLNPEAAERQPSGMYAQENYPPEYYQQVRNVRERIRDVITEQDTAEKARKRQELERQMLEQLEHDKRAAERLSQEMVNQISNKPEETEGRIGKVKLSPADQQKSEEIQGDVLATLELIKNEIINPPDNSRQLLNELANRVNEQDIPQNELVLLNPLVSQLARNEISFSGPGEDPTDFEKEYRRIAGLGTDAGRWLYNYLENNASTLGLNQEKLDELLEINRAQKELTDLLGNKGYSEYINSEDIRTFGRFFIGDKEGLRILNAISSAENFKRYYDELKQDQLYADNPQELSKKIMDDVRLTFNKLTRQTLRKRPTAIFDQEIRKGFPDSPENAVVKFTLKITNLVDRIDGVLKEDREKKVLKMQTSVLKKGMHYVTSKREIDKHMAKGHKVDEIDHLFDEDRRGMLHTAMESYIIAPTHKLQDVTMKEFLEGLELAVDTEYEMTEYFYNIQTLFARPGHGDGGHWESIKQYAEHLNALSLDTLPLVVDADMIMSARRIYLKFLRAQFSAQNWIHSSGMFTSDFYTNKSPLLQAVMEELKVLYPKEANNPDQAWRIEQAMSKAIGISFGVTLDDPETAAWADAPIVVRDDANADATAKSFYRGDSRILSAFDPFIDMLRFQGEDQSIGPLLYAMLKEPINKKGQPFDHRAMWEQMQRYKESFREGKAAIDELGDEAYVAIDQMKNFFEVGSIFYRGGWRDLSAVDGWIKKDLSNGYADAEQAWDSVKYIGSQVAMRIVDNSNFQKALNKMSEKDRNDFLEKLYKQYIVPIDSSKSFTQYMQDIRDSIAEFDTLLQKYRLNERDLTDRGLLVGKGLTDDEIKRLRELKADARKDYKIPPDPNNVFLNRVVAAQMMRWTPTRFLTLERSRTSEDGVTMYETVRQDVFPVKKKEGEAENLTETEAVDASVQSGALMNQALRDIMIVEESLRVQVSKTMREHLQDQRIAVQDGREPLLHLDDLDKKHPDLHGIYNIDEATIQSKLEEIYLNEDITRHMSEDKLRQYTADIKTRTEYAQKVYKKIMDVYKNEGYIAKRGADLRNKKYRIALGNDDLDWEFMAYRNAGERPHGRAISDTARAESSGSKMQQFERILQKIAENPDKPNDEELIALIEDIHTTVKNTHSFEKAGEKSYLIAKLAALYFRQDADTHKWWKGFGAGKLHSIAAEFAGTNHVFDWDAVATHQFVERLKIRRLLRPHRTYKPLNEENAYGKKQTLLGKHDYADWSAERFEQEMAAHKQNIILQAAHTYGPAAIALLAFLYLRHAIKEEEESRR